MKVPTVEQLKARIAELELPLEVTDSVPCSTGGLDVVIRGPIQTSAISFETRGGGDLESASASWPTGWDGRLESLEEARDADEDGHNWGVMEACHYRNLVDAVLRTEAGLDLAGDYIGD